MGFLLFYYGTETVCPVERRLKYSVMVLLMVPLIDNQEHDLINILVQSK